MIIIIIYNIIPLLMLTLLFNTAQADPLATDHPDYLNEAEFNNFEIKPVTTNLSYDYDERFYGLISDKESLENYLNVHYSIEQVFIEEDWLGKVPTENFVSDICSRMGNTSFYCYSALIRYKNNIPYGKNFEIIASY